MKRLRIYLETSVFGFLIGEPQGALTEATFKLLEEIAAGNFDAFVSTEVMRELEKAPEPIRPQLLNLALAHEIHELPVTEEARELAAQYMAASIIPAEFEPDALHIAIASVEGLDVLVSWNLQHIVKTRTRLGVNGINKLLGYREIEIATPQEVISG